MARPFVPRRATLVFALAALAASACAAESDAVLTAGGNLTQDGGPNAKSYPAYPYSLPELVSSGGPVLANPTIVPITFDGDPMRDDIEAFVTKLASSSYWKAIGADYGVTGATAGTPIHLADAAPAAFQSDDLATWAATQFEGGALGTPDTNAIYALYLPSGTQVDQGGGVACKDFGAYHDEVRLNDAVQLVFAVIPRCEEYTTAIGSSIGGADFVTFSSSHEFIEAATDPYPFSKPAYQDVDTDHALWSWVFASEVGDLCARGQSWTSAPNDVGVAVQRMWSNAAAKAGKDPCVPAPKPHNFNAVPVLPETIDLAGMTNSGDDGGDVDPTMPPASFDGGDDPSAAAPAQNAPGITIAVGQSKTIEVHLSSDGPTSGPWKVRAIDWDNRKADGPENLSFSFDRDTGTNGDVLHVTITAKTSGTHAFVLESTLDGASTYWPGAVLVPQ